MAYVQKYEYRFYDFYDNLHYTVKILQDGGDAGTTDIQYATENILQYKTSKVSRSNLDIVYGSEVKFSFVVNRDDIPDYDPLFESYYKEWRLDLYRNAGAGDGIIFSGYILPENIDRSLLNNNIVIQLSAVDGLKDLANEEFRDDGQIVVGKENIMQILKTALTPIGIELPWKVKLGTYEKDYHASDANCLFETQVFTERFSRVQNGKTSVDSCLEVIEKVLKNFNVTLRQCKGYYHIQAKHEVKSYDHYYTWALGFQGRASSGDVINTYSWKIIGDPNLSLIGPLKRVDITHRNRNLGNAVVEDLDDWTGTGPWSIPASIWFGREYTEDSGKTLVLPDEDGQYPSARYIKLSSDFALSKVTDSDYVKVIARVKVRNTDSDYGDNEYYSVSRLVIEHVDESLTLTASTINLSGDWATIETPNVNAALIRDSGDFNVYIQFESIGSGGFSCEYLIRDVFISKVTAQEGDEIVVDISYDEFTRVEKSIEGRDVEEMETFFGDTGQSNDLGGMYITDSAEHNTSLWRRYNTSQSKSLLELYGEVLLMDRARYKEFITGMTFHDVNDQIYPSSILIMARDGESRYYRIQSYEKDFRFNNITLRLEQILYSTIGYSATKVILTSVDGQSSGGSTSVSSSGTSFTLADHNLLTGGVHLAAGERTNWDTAYDERHQWDGGSTNLVASIGRTSLELGTAALLNVGDPVYSGRVLIGTDTDEFSSTNYLTFSTSMTDGAHNLSIKYDSTHSLVLWANTASYAWIYYFAAGAGGMWIGEKYALVVKANKNICINTNTDSGHNLNVNGSMNIGTTADIGGVLTAKDDVGSESFVSGFAGSGWRLEVDSAGDNTFTVDNLYVRKAMNVYELIINQIRATNGSLWVTDAVKIISSELVAESPPTYDCTIDTDEGYIAVPFVTDDILRCQKWNGRGVKYYSAEVQSVSSNGEEFRIEIIDGSDTPEAEDIMVRIGSGDTDRQGSIYLTSSDSNAPYIDILDGVDSYSFANKTVVRLGNLSGITDTDFGGSLSGYGLYSTNAYLKGGIYADNGEIGGWTIESDYISKGFVYLSSKINTSGYTVDSFNEIGRGLYMNTMEESSKDTTIQIGQIWPVYTVVDSFCVGQFDSSKGYEYGINVCRPISGADPEFQQKVIFRIGDSSGAIASLSFDEDKFYTESSYFKYNYGVEAWEFSGDLIVETSGSGGLTDAPVKLYNLSTSNNTPVLNLYQGATGTDRDVLRVYSDYDSAGGTDEGGLRISYGSLGIVQGSDVNRKTSITTINTGLSIINKLNPVEYLWKDDRKNPENNTKLAGLIAQEVEKILPNMVSTSEEGEKFININYPIPYLIAAIQELTNQVEQLKKKEK